MTQKTILIHFKFEIFLHFLPKSSFQSWEVSYTQHFRLFNKSGVKLYARLFFIWYGMSTYKQIYMRSGRGYMKSSTCTWNWNENLLLRKTFHLIAFLPCFLLFFIYLYLTTALKNFSPSHSRWIESLLSIYSPKRSRNKFLKTPRWVLTRNSTLGSLSSLTKKSVF